MTDELCIRDLVVRRGRRDVIRGVSMNLEPGSITTLLGPNGAGKSTLVLAVAGVLEPAAGSIVLGGVELIGRRPDAIHRLGLATVPEGHRVLGPLTVGDNLVVASAHLSRTDARAATAQVFDVLPDLARLRHRTAGTLSGGQQQMLALAQGLVSRPRFLIVDELSLGLSPAIVRRLMPVLTEVASQDVGVLLIEQFTNVALEIASDAYVLVRGDVVLHESAAHLRENPQLIDAAYHVGTADGSGTEEEQEQ